MQKLLYGIGGLLALLIVIGFLLPAKGRFVVSAEVDAPAATVFALVNDMRRVDAWLPISNLDANAQVVFSGPARGIGSTRTWDGIVAGSGTQTITDSRPHTYVEMRINSGEPAETKTWFELTDGGPRTLVNWGYEHDYGLNVVGRYVGAMITGVIRREYEQGIANLRDYAETLPVTDFGDLEIEQIVVESEPIALRPVSSAPDPAAMSEAMGEAYFEILAYIDRHGLAEAGAPLAIMRRPRGSKLRFDAAIPVRGVTDDTTRSSGNVRIDDTYEGPVIRVRHTGPYRALGDTHRKILAYLTVLDIRQNGDPWESFVSDPAETPEAELLTWIYYPIVEM